MIKWTKKTISRSYPFKGVAGFWRLTRRLLCTQRKLAPLSHSYTPTPQHPSQPSSFKKQMEKHTARHWLFGGFSRTVSSSIAIGSESRGHLRPAQIFLEDFLRIVFWPPRILLLRRGGGVTQQPRICTNNTRTYICYKSKFVLYTYMFMNFRGENLPASCMSVKKEIEVEKFWQIFPLFGRSFSVSSILQYEVWSIYNLNEMVGCSYSCCSNICKKQVWLLLSVYFHWSHYLRQFSKWTKEQ